MGAVLAAGGGASVGVLVVGAVDAAPPLGHQPGGGQGEPGGREGEQRQQPHLVGDEREVGRDDGRLPEVPARRQRPGEGRRLGEDDDPRRPQRVEGAGGLPWR